MAKLPIDPDSHLVEKEFAVVYAPRKQRDRFPENCVVIKENIEEAMASADPEKNSYAALVYGPCRSSEGFRLFYLVEWL